MGLAAAVVVDAVSSRAKPPQAASLVEDKDLLDRHPNIFICPNVGNKDLDVVIRHRKYGWDSIDMQDAEKEHWSEAVYQPITTCPMTLEMGFEK